MQDHQFDLGADDQALLNEIFRAAHTIKGSSATIGHTRMAALIVDIMVLVAQAVRDHTTDMPLAEAA